MTRSDEPTPRDYPSEFLKGTLDIAVMSILSEQARHGYGVTTVLRERTDGTVTLSAGAVYPVLHRLERKGLIESTWEIGATGRRTKVYSCTTAGAGWLSNRASQWDRFSAAMRSVLGDCDDNRSAQETTA